MTISSATPAPPLSQFLLGARLFAPVAVSIAAYGLVWGVLARQAGLSVGEVALMSALVFAGASQFVALDMWAPGALPVGAIVLAVAIVNLRMLLMTATLRPLAIGVPKPRALLAVHFVADENWALTMGELAKGRGSLAFLLGSGVLCWAVWLAATLIGRLLGSAIDDPARYGLDFAFTATFIALLLGMWKGKSDSLPWLVAALAAIAASRLLPGNWYIIIGGLLGSLAGALADSRREQPDVR
ncbi:MAG TPA: AzlC family ABC transporter permease [Devosiaceae bacterium]|jgi:4-azaleucine resistance transporter AzlC|nr:AzlC family ABC transporter permease [Devosiaceae bacterium]